jgi:hypothetical protein
MTPAAHGVFGIATRRGFWLRCFLGVFGLGAYFTIVSPQIARAQSIVDCVYPGRVSVSRVQGRVYDPFGVVVPGVVVTLVDERGSTLQATTDNQGRFRIAAPPGKYSFKAVFPMFQTSMTELNVGEDLAGLVRPSDLYVTLGLDGMYCAWVTTGRKEFQQIVKNNKKRSEESTQRNATQK